MLCTSPLELGDLQPCCAIGISAVGHHQERRRRAHNNVTGPITGGQIARLDDIRGQRGSSDRKGEESSEEDWVGMSILSDRLR
jgi:hypothetical protein